MHTPITKLSFILLLGVVSLSCISGLPSSTTRSVTILLPTHARRAESIPHAVVTFTGTSSQKSLEISSEGSSPVSFNGPPSSPGSKEPVIEAVQVILDQVAWRLSGSNRCPAIGVSKWEGIPAKSAVHGKQYYTFTLTVTLYDPVLPFKPGVYKGRISAPELDQNYKDYKHLAVNGRLVGKDVNVNVAYGQAQQNKKPVETDHDGANAQIMKYDDWDTRVKRGKKLEYIMSVYLRKLRFFLYIVTALGSFESLLVKGRKRKRFAHFLILSYLLSIRNTTFFFAHASTPTQFLDCMSRPRFHFDLCRIGYSSSMQIPEVRHRLVPRKRPSISKYIQHIDVFFQGKPYRWQTPDEIERAKTIIETMVRAAWEQMNIEPVWSRDRRRVEKVLMPSFEYDGFPGDWTFNMMLTVKLKGPKVCKGECTLAAKQRSGKPGLYDLTIRNDREETIYSSGQFQVKVVSESRRRG
ncbi:hypothetical protein F5050DRAFT_1716036 [Lentinula boryana]|uniref:Uncharacterized protein n=1 Tax=Lentinula boryana TaxID=40481 RepID=A0ABQ8PZB4_9AGAR|nr:hypothetical protein F5050DRAFT_1716036 [Lentinula boryana]